MLIDILDRIEELCHLSPLEALLRTLTFGALHTSVKERVLYWKLRAKFRYTVDGDENTGFLHASASARFRRNCIPVLSFEGRKITSHADKAVVLREYYKALLGTASPCDWTFSLSDLYPDVAPLPESLSGPFSAEEVQTTFF